MLRLKMIYASKRGYCLPLFLLRRGRRNAIFFMYCLNCLCPHPSVILWFIYRFARWTRTRCDRLNSVRNKMLYALSWRTVYALIRTQKILFDTDVMDKSLHPIDFNALNYSLTYLNSSWKYTMSWSFSKNSYTLGNVVNTLPSRVM